MLKPQVRATVRALASVGLVALSALATGLNGIVSLLFLVVAAVYGAAFTRSLQVAGHRIRVTVTAGFFVGLLAIWATVFLWYLSLWPDI